MDASEMNSRTTSDRCPHCGHSQVPSTRGEWCPSCLARVALIYGQKTTPETPGNEHSQNPGRNAPEPVKSTAIPSLADFEILGEIARGGMGVVYKARQFGVDRIVAIKTLHGGVPDSQQNMARLRHEARVLAGLRHPNIVTLHALGESEGRPFLVLEYVEGQNLLESVRNHPMAPSTAALLVAKVANAVQHAHGQSILHRDLKPSNILIDAQGDPHVSDFGIARLLGDDSELTRTGQVIGSPSFMPPEQLTGGRNVLQPPGDVYSLGAILYFTLTGRAPFVGPDLESVLIQCLGNDPPAPRLLNPGIPAELETLALKCLQRDPLARFPRAGDLADELHRFLRGEPIRSQPLSPIQRAFRWCRRYPVVAGLGAALGAAIITVITIVLVASVRLAEKARELRHAEYVVDMRRVQQAIEADHLAYAREILARHQPEDAPQPGRKPSRQNDLRGWEWYHFALKVRGNEQYTLRGHSNGVTVLAFAPQHPWLASGSTDGSLALWDLSRTSLLTQTSITGRIDALEFSALGQNLLSGDNQGNVRFWRLPEWVETSQPMRWTSGIVAIRQLPEGNRVAVVSRSSFDLVDVDHRQIVESIPMRVWQRAGIRSDGKQAAAGQYDGHVVVASNPPHAPATQWRSHSAMVLAAAFSFDHRWLASGGFDAIASIRNLQENRDVAVLRGHADTVSGMSFSPDHRWLATASFDRRVRLWDVPSWNEAAILRGHGSAVWSLAFSPDSQRVASGSKDGEIKLWSVLKSNRPAEADGVLTVPSEFHLNEGTRLLPDDTIYALMVSPVGLRVGRFDTNLVELPPLVALSNGWYSAAIQGSTSPDILPINHHDLRLEILDLKTHTRMPVLGAHQSGMNVAVTLDRRFAATTGGEGSFAIVAEVGKPGFEQKLPAVEGKATYPLFSETGEYLAVGTLQDGIFIWSTRTRQPHGWLVGHRYRVDGLAAAPGANHLASASEDGTVRTWDLESLKPLRTYRSSADSYWSVAWSPDGRRIAAGTGDGRVVVWDRDSGEEMITLKAGEPGVVKVMGFTRDGRNLLGYTTRQITIWRTAAAIPPDEHHP